MKPQSLIATIATVNQALMNSHDRGNHEWLQRWQDHLVALYTLLPSGAGIDNGTSVDSVTETRIVLSCDFHHMNDQGSYDGWTEHVITVTPGFTGIDIRVGGRNRNNIKSYLADTYHECLTSLVEHYTDDSGETPMPRYRFVTV